MLFPCLMVVLARVSVHTHPSGSNRACAGTGFITVTISCLGGCFTRICRQRKNRCAKAAGCVNTQVSFRFEDLMQGCGRRPGCIADAWLQFWSTCDDSTALYSTMRLIVISDDLRNGPCAYSREHGRRDRTAYKKGRKP